MSVSALSSRRADKSIGAAVVGLVGTLLIFVLVFVAFLIAPLMLLAIAYVAYLVMRPRQPRPARGPTADHGDVPVEPSSFGAGAR